MSKDDKLSPLERALSDAVKAALPQDASGLAKVSEKPDGRVVVSFEGTANKAAMLQATATALTAVQAQFPGTYELDVKIRAA
ncbi:MAG TPA: hypothetical protein VHL98_17240 [Microvirga sp.]|nr:hypothetical protein [Microvirga sp.]